MEFVRRDLAAIIDRQHADQQNHGIYAVDQYFNVIYWNKVMERITGIPYSICMGKNLFSFFPFLQAIGEEIFLKKTLNGAEQHVENRPYLTLSNQEKDGYAAKFLPLHEEDGIHVAGAVVFIAGLGMVASPAH